MEFNQLHNTFDTLSKTHMNTVFVDSKRLKLITANTFHKTAQSDITVFVDLKGGN